MKVKKESEKVGLKLNIQKTKIMASSPITSWEIDGETVEIVSDFILGGSKITADGDCSHEIKRRLLLGRKVMTNLLLLLSHFSRVQLCATLETVAHQAPPSLVFSLSRFSSVAQSCPTLCDPTNHSMPGLPVHHQLPEFTQTHVHRVGDAIQLSHPLLSPFPLARLRTYRILCPRFWYWRLARLN